MRMQLQKPFKCCSNDIIAFHVSYFCPLRVSDPSKFIQLSLFLFILVLT